MACLKVRDPAGNVRLIPEDPRDRNVRGTKLGDTIIGVERRCGPQWVDSDLESLVTVDGLMVGNIVKAVATAVGIKQCLACKGRQKRWNEKGLELQKKVKRAVLRS